MVIHKHFQEKTAEIIPFTHLNDFFDKNALFLTKLSSISTNGVIVVDNDDGGDDDDDNGDDGLIHQPALKTDWGNPLNASLTYSRYSTHACEAQYAMSNNYRDNCVVPFDILNKHLSSKYLQHVTKRADK